MRITLCIVLLGPLLSTTVHASSCSGGYGCTCPQCADSGYSYFCPSNSECYSYEATCGTACQVPCQPTTTCGQTCQQCQQSAYDYYCPSPYNTCYNSYATCDISCPVTCVNTQTCSPNITCTPAQSSSCNSSTQTCCMSSQGEAFCSDYPNAVCCNIDTMSCPRGTICDPITKGCAQPDNGTLACQVCEKIMGTIIEKGCEYACEVFNTSIECIIIKELDLCDWIEKELESFESPQQACGMFGLCGGGTCDCGYCTPQLYGQYCMSVPNTCPPSGRLQARSWHLRGGSALPTPVNKGSGDFCLDGECDSSHIGCCLTCA